MDGEIDYGALFGVGGPEEGGSVEPNDVPQDSPAQEPENSGDGSAAPEGTEQVLVGQEGGQEQDGGQEPGGGQGQAVPSGEGPSRQPSAARYEAAIAQAQADAQRTIDEAFARSGLRNPYTGQPITTKAEYDAYREKFDAERRAQVLKQTGMSEEEFGQFIQGLPEVRKAQEARETAEKAQREAREAAARVKIDEQLREIGAMDPSVKSLEDLARMPTYPRFYELVQRGNTLTDAFKLANFDALSQRAAAGARQAAVNAARSKEHLEQTRTRGKGAVSVPAEVRAQYKLFNPDATDEEIQRHYAKSHRRED